MASETAETELVVLPAEHLDKPERPILSIGRKPGEPRFYLSHPDWSFWGKHGRLPLVDVILLSVDLVPETEPPSTPTGVEKIRLFKSVLAAENVARLDKRTRIVLSSVEELRFADGGTGGLASPVRLLDFRDFASVKGLQLPVGFPKRTAPDTRNVDAKPPSDEEDGGDPGLSRALATGGVPQRDPTKPDKPDWSFWVLVPVVSVLDVSVLACDVDPRWFNTGASSGPKLRQIVERGKELRELIEHGIAIPGTVYRAAPGTGIAGFQLRPFGQWAKEVRKWTLPAGFPMPEKEPEPVAPPVRPARAPSKPLGTRERGHLITVIAALAKKAGIDIYQRRKAGDTLERLVKEQLGKKVSSRAIQNYLKVAEDLIERRTDDSADDE